MFAGIKTEPYLEMNIRNADIDAYYAWDKNLTNHDLIPFIWHSYDKDLNYLTMYNEEWAYFGCFNYLKHGNCFFLFIDFVLFIFNNLRISYTFIF